MVLSCVPATHDAGLTVGIMDLFHIGGTCESGIIAAAGISTGPAGEVQVHGHPNLFQSSQILEGASVNSGDRIGNGDLFHLAQIAEGILSKRCDAVLDLDGGDLIFILIPGCVGISRIAGNITLSGQDKRTAVIQDPFDVLTDSTLCVVIRFLDQVRFNAEFLHGFHTFQILLAGSQGNIHSFRDRAGLMDARLIQIEISTQQIAALVQIGNCTAIRFYVFQFLAITVQLDILGGKHLAVDGVNIDPIIPVGAFTLAIFTQGGAVISLQNGCPFFRDLYFAG